MLLLDVELLHTRVTQSVAYSSTCDDVESTGFRARGGSYSDCVGGEWWDHSVPSACSRRINCSIYAFVVGSVRQFLWS
jgi:hypothetical protein